MMLDSYMVQVIALAVVGSFLFVGYGAAMIYIGAYLQRWNRLRHDGWFWRRK